MEHPLPFLTALKEYAEQDYYPFHTPGHKGGRGVSPEFAQLLTNTLKADVSLLHGLDDIHYPTGILQEAQNLAAQIYGADRSFFCVNGTSGAIHAMIMAALQPDEAILLPRNAHRSVVGALVLSGAQPIYVNPQYDSDFCFVTQITCQDVQKQLFNHSDIKAVLVTTPNYYGIAAKLCEIEKTVHATGALLLVDEAHGPHLGFSEVLPLSALQCGADAVAQSTHKILGAMTQASILHVKKGRMDPEKVRQAISLLTTTSPNQLLLASLDAVFNQICMAGREMMEKAVASAIYFRKRLAEIDGLKVFIDQRENLFDLTKITVNFSDIGYTGHEAECFLRSKGITVEFADKSNVLFLITYADTITGINMAVQALRELAARSRETLTRLSLSLPEPQILLTPRQAFFSKRGVKLLSEARGFIAAEEVTFYPPGIPVLLPGERISEDVLLYCRMQADNKQEYREKYINVVL